MKLYPCTLCGQCAYSKKSLAKHRSKMHKTQIKENQAKNTKPDLKNDKGEWICRKMVKTVKYQMLNFHFFFKL